MTVMQPAGDQLGRFRADSCRSLNSHPTVEFAQFSTRFSNPESDLGSVRLSRDRV